MSNVNREEKGRKTVESDMSSAESQEIKPTAEMVVGESLPEVNHQKAALEAVEMAQKEILYIRAEFENYKKRIHKEQEQAVRFGNKAIILDLLNVLDLFERAGLHGKVLKEKNDKELNGFISGIEMTHQELVKLMQRFGVEFIGKAGEKFDPDLHEAVTQLSNQDETEVVEDFVAEVVKRGCRLHGKLIKPAQVVVGRR